MKRVVFTLALAAAAAASAGLKALPYFQAQETKEAGGPAPVAPPRPRMIGSGLVEAIGGQIDVAAQIPGTLAELRVEEGTRVEQGDVIAVLEGARQVAELAKAAERVRLAEAHLERTLAGHGDEEVAQALAEAQAVAAQLRYEQSRLERTRKLAASRAATQDELDLQTERVEQLRHQHEGLQKQYEALRRGPLPEEVAVARAELQLAQAEWQRTQVEHDYRFVRAPISGTVIELHRHAGDSVSIEQFTPIARIADTTELRIRVEIAEANVPRIEAGLTGEFELRGIPGRVGTLQVETIVPVFGPKRLFNPDTSAEHDGRTLTVLCTIVESRLPLYPGQRLTATFVQAETLSETAYEPIAQIVP